MTGETFTREVTITNPHGLHLRPIQEFVLAAKRFDCDVTLTKSGQPAANGKSAISILGLAAEQGTKLVLEVAGPDAGHALEELVAVLQKLYDE